MLEDTTRFALGPHRKSYIWPFIYSVLFIYMYTYHAAMLKYEINNNKENNKKKIFKFNIFFTLCLVSQNVESMYKVCD